MIVSTTPADYGEQVRLWLRAGLTAADLQAASPVLAAACWAAEVRVVPGVRHAHLVTLQVIRRQPERVWPALDDSPAPRRVAGDGLGGTGEARRWPGQVVPPPRLSPRQDWAESGGRSNALVPSDDGY